MTEITASADTLMHQASTTVHSYMTEAKRAIDKVFGEGHAKAHPELVAGFIQAAAIDLGGAIMAKVIGEAIESLADATRMVANACEQNRA